MVLNRSVPVANTVLPLGAIPSNPMGEADDAGLLELGLEGRRKAEMPIESPEPATSETELEGRPIRRHPAAGALGSACFKNLRHSQIAW